MKTPKQKAKLPQTRQRRREARAFLIDDDRALENPDLSMREYNEIRDRQDRKGATELKAAFKELDLELHRLKALVNEILASIKHVRLPIESASLGAENKELLRQIAVLSNKLG